MCRFFIDVDSLFADPELLEPPLNIDIRCCGPSSTNCDCVGKDCRLIEKIIGMSYEEGLKLREKDVLTQISDRWCCMPYCGFHTRLHATKSYDLLFIHSTVGYEGAHLAVLNDKGRQIIKEFVEKHVLKRS